MQLVQWDRVTELWYDSFAAWRNAVIDNPPAYTLPEWATDPFYPETTDKFPFFKPGVDFVSTLPARAADGRVQARHPLLPAVSRQARR